MVVVRLGTDLQEGESFGHFMSVDQIAGVEAMVLRWGCARRSGGDLGF